MFITRTISGAVLLAIIIAAILSGGYVWFGLCLALSLIAMYEMFKVLKLEHSVIAPLGYIADVCMYILILNNYASMSVAVLIIYFVCVMALYVIKWPSFKVDDISRAVFAFVYTGLCMSFMYQLRTIDNGIYYIWLVFIGAWGSDTCAYLTGILIGKHKIPSTLSPKKTIEGCIGGVVGAAIIGLAYGCFVNGRLEGSINYMLVFSITGAIGSVLSQIGDLCASAVKRNCQIKDYGKLIPGHGGVMDRFDSIIFLAPIIYYILYLFV